MARYEHLPIYRDALALAQIVANFSRCHKYTLGSELRNASLAEICSCNFCIPYVPVDKAVTLIIKANNQSDNLAGLLALRDHLENYCC
jgi:hypothetical protein